MRHEPLRVLFYSHDGHGLGHLRMFQPLAEALARRDPSAVILIATGARKVDVDSLPESIDFIKLPAVRSSEALAPLRPVQGSGYRWPGLWSIREALLHETARAFDPHLLIGDNEPNGMQGELTRALKLIRAQTPRAKTALGMFDFLGDRDGVIERWSQEGGMEALAAYDRPMFFGQREIFDAAAEYGFPEPARANTRYPGYLVRDAAPGDLAALRAKWGAAPGQPFVVAAAGGGENGHDLLSAAIAFAETRSDARLLLITGPQMAITERADLRRRVESHLNVVMTDFLVDLPALFAVADAVAIKGGYSSVAEAVRAGKRPIIAPRDDIWTEQRQRAVRFAELGLATVILPRELTSERLTKAIATELQRGISPPPMLRGGGTERSVDELMALAPPPEGRWRARSLSPATLIAERTPN